MAIVKVFRLIIFILFFKCSFQYNEEYHEELYIKPTSSGHINTFFQFTTRWKLDTKDDLYNTHLLPRLIAEIHQQYDVKEMHISLTQGLWRYENWGYPIVDAGPGAEIWAWFSGNLSSHDVDSQWKNLCSILSGVLCASLNFVDKTNSVEPKYSFRPTFGSPSPTKDTFIRYATLPRENVCTENLTPWKKLLPCNIRNGLASLLNSGHVYNTNYHSLTISTRTLCNSQLDQGCVIEFKETANLIYDSKLLGGPDFSIRKMFGQGLNGVCPLANSTKVYVDVTDNRYDIKPNATNTFTSLRGGHEAVIAEYDVSKESPNAMFNIAWVKKDASSGQGSVSPPPIFAHRYILNHGQEHGKIVTKIKNTHWSPINVVLQESIPWFVPSYLHTLMLRTANGKIIPKAIHYIPGQRREKAYHLEVVFEVPAKSWVELSFEFDYIFLKWLEYPPDANHGHYLGSSIITAALPTGKNYSAIPVNGFLISHSFNATSPCYILRLHTESLILSLPTPDFSMPYNVICLACTVVALAFGPIHNVATKKMILEKKNEGLSIWGKIKNFFTKNDGDEEESQNVAVEEEPQNNDSDEL